MGINPTHIPEIIIIVYNLLFAVECSQSQSFVLCKRVGVKSHIPYLLDSIDMSTINLGKSVIQVKKENKRGKLYGQGSSFWTFTFLHRE